MKTCSRKMLKMLDATRCVDFLGPLALRLFLVVPLWHAGTRKLQNLDGTINFFTDIGLPLPTLMAYVAALLETFGAIALLFGLGVRFISIPLMIVMLVATFSVHWQNGWYAIAPAASAGGERIAELSTWLETNHPEQHTLATEFGRLVLLNNGVQFAVTYFVMLLVLFFIGAGKYVSIDYWIRKHLIANETNGYASGQSY